MGQYFNERALGAMSGFLVSLLYLRMIDKESVKIWIWLFRGQVLIADRIEISSALYDDGQS
jgi:hypothetical protein